MNLTTARALGMDAMAQVLDNRVFRILGGATLLVTLLTLCIGFREEEVVLLFGLKRYDYDVVLNWLPIFDKTGSPQVLTIRFLQGLVVDFFGGKLGVMIALTSTSFFVPKMLEKGAADTFFSKPITRFAWYMSRYITGVLFVFLLASMMILGMHFALLLGSGYSDAGFLWGAVTMTYAFALIHAVGMLAGAITRSSVAALLVALMFFMFNGCVHYGWIIKEHEIYRASQYVEQIESKHEDAKPEDAGSESELEEEEPFDPMEDLSGVELFAMRALDAMHYVLPKTTDAAYLTSMLREAVEPPPPYHDLESGLILDAYPGDWSQGQESPHPPGEGELAWGEPSVVFEHADGVQVGRAGLFRRERRDIAGVGDRVRRERVRDAVSDLEELLENAGHSVAKSERTRVGRRSALQFSWSREGADSAPVGRAWVFDGWPDWLWVLWCEVDAQGVSAEEIEDGLLTSLVFEGDSNAGTDSAEDAWYQKRLGWTSEWRYNAFFSIGSSLLFTALMILLGWWKLARTDF